MTSSRVALAAASVVTVLLLQATLVGPLTFPVAVSLPVLFVAVVGIFTGPGAGIALGFATGLLADLGSDHPAGVLAMTWMAAGLTAGVLGGLATQRNHGTRPIALLAAGIATAASFVSATLLALLGSHAASFWLAVHDLIPVGLTDSLIGLVLVPLVRVMLRRHGVRSPRPGVEMIGRIHVNV